MQANLRIIIGAVLIALALVLVVIVLYRNSAKSDTQLVFSPAQALGALWSEYKVEYLEESTGRTLDKQRDNITTSEGQSYTMLRSVWQSDKETFDRSWTWTKDNLQHDDDALISWLFGELPSGEYGILTDQGGQNSATDADTDIALALIFAYARWEDPEYLASARAILNDLWESAVITIDGKPYLLANDLEKFSQSANVIANPSYLSPAHYRVFAKVDPDHDWEALADASYDLINRSMDAGLDTETSVGLPPNWIYVDRTTGELSPIPNPTLTTNFGYDAFRTPWRLALDYQWFGTREAEETLRRMSFLSERWKEGKLVAEYGRDGTPLTDVEAPAMYGGTIGYFMVADPQAAGVIYDTKLVSLYSGSANGWGTPLGYYDSNWAWFGIGLYSEQLPNLADVLP